MRSFSALVTLISFLFINAAGATELPPKLVAELQAHLEETCGDSQVRLSVLETSERQERLDQGADFYYTTKYFAQFLTSSGRSFTIRATAELGLYEISNPAFPNVEVLSLGFTPTGDFCQSLF